MSASDVDVAIVGGGITGLAAARFVAENSTASIVLLEGGTTLGGKIRTERVGDVEVEVGADSFLARTPEAVALARALDLEKDLVAPAVFGALIATDKGLLPFPRGSLYGIPAEIGSLIRTGALSPLGRLRALGELFSTHRLNATDRSVGSFVARKFGRQVLDRLVDPLLAGTRAGDVHAMSLAAALPQIHALARKHRSLLRGISSERAHDRLESGPPPFLKVRSGMHRLIDELDRRLKERVDIRLNDSVESIHIRRDRVEIEGGSSLTARATIFAAPAFAASAALSSVDAEAARLLGRIEYASVASVALAYESAQVTLPDGFSGVLVPTAAGRTVSAITFYSRKWPHDKTDKAVLRCVVGRSGRHPALDLDDEEIVAAVKKDLRILCNVRGEPQDTNVVRWERSLPQYSVGHLDRLNDAERRVQDQGPIFVAGAGYRGSGIPDCIKQGEKAGQSVLSILKGG